MLISLEDYFGPDQWPLVMWSALAVIALLVALLVFFLVRRAFSGTYVVGGRNRRPRLAILDATAVDARRRLVLVRRDEIEHLILIGGPTDVVIEAGIRPGGMPVPRQAAPAPGQPQRRPAPAQPPMAPPPQPVQPAPYRSEAPAPLAPRPAAEPTLREPELILFEPAPPPREPAPVVAPAPPKPVERPAPPPPEPMAVEPPAPASPFRRFFSPKPAAEAAPAVPRPAPAAPRPAPTAAPAQAVDDVDRSLEEEMSRLLEEIGDPKK